MNKETKEERDSRYRFGALMMAAGFGLGALGLSVGGALAFLLFPAIIIFFFGFMAGLDPKPDEREW